MSEKTLKSRIVNKHDIEANWKLATNFSPLAGEIIIYDPDENNENSRVKIGDGETNVNDLPFVTDTAKPTDLVVNMTAGFVAGKGIVYSCDTPFVDMWAAYESGGNVMFYIDGIHTSNVEFLIARADDAKSIHLAYINGSVYLEYTINEDDTVTWKSDSLITRTNLEETTGTDTAAVMSQKAVTDALALKADQTSLDEVSALVGDTAVSTQISEAIDGLPQSDWNQSDETASDYIKNRPFYEETSLQRFDITDKFTFTSQTSEGFVFQLGEGTFTLPFVFTIGETYKFTINGTEYETVCRDVTNIMSEGWIGFGDIDAILNGDITSVNFYAAGYYNLDNPSEFMMQPVVKTESEITEFAIDGVALNIVKIDKKYLPNSIESINGITPDSNGAIELTNVDLGVAKIIEVTVIDNKASMTPKEIADTVSEGNIVTLSGAYSYGGNYNNCATFYKVVRDADILIPIIYFAKINLSKDVTYYSHAIDLESLGLPDNGDESKYLTMTDNGAYVFRSLPVASTSNGGIEHGRYASKANAAGSVALGINTIANYVSEYVTGRFNIASTEVVENIPDGGDKGKYVHIVGNGVGADKRSNAHTLDWEGNAWFSGDVYTGSTSGTNRDEGSKKLASEDYVDNAVGSSVFTVELVANEDGTPSANKTLEEITEAYESGKTIKMDSKPYVLDFIYVNEDAAYFSSDIWFENQLKHYVCEVDKYGIVQMEYYVENFNNLTTESETIVGAINELDAEIAEVSTLVGDTPVATQISNATTNYYTKAEIDAYEFITIADIDEICGGVTEESLPQSDIDELMAQLG